MNYKVGDIVVSNRPFYSKESLDSYDVIQEDIPENSIGVITKEHTGRIYNDYDILFGNVLAPQCGVSGIRPATDEEKALYNSPLMKALS